MTQKKQETKIIVYERIRQFIEENGYSPSVRDLCQMTGLKSTSSVAAQLMNLKIMGVIDYKPNTPRSIRILNQIPKEEI